MKKLFLLLLGLACLVGCSDKLQLGGKVTYEDGSPLPVGSVVFATSSFEAVGTLDSEGKYVVGSIDVADGLPKGTYKVYISGAMEPTPGKGELMRSLIDETYANFSTTPLTADIPAPNNILDFKVPKNPKIK